MENFLGTEEGILAMFASLIVFVMILIVIAGIREVRDNNKKKGGVK